MKDSDALLPVFDPISHEFQGYKPRKTVHTTGDWHKGIQANIIVPNNKGSFDLLLQKRSQVVDIAKGKYDQSLATQMIKNDHLSEHAALRRGLSQELGITKYKWVRANIKFKIVKTYEYDHDLFNRELVSLYIVMIKDKSQVKKHNNKIGELQWIDWEFFQASYHKERYLFTKTAQMYFDNERVNSVFRAIASSMIKNSTVNNQEGFQLFHITLQNKVRITLELDDSVPSTIRIMAQREFLGALLSRFHEQEI